MTLLAPMFTTHDHAVVYMGESDDFHIHSIAHRWVVRVAKHATAAHALRKEASLLPLLGARLPLHLPTPVAYYPGTPRHAAFGISAQMRGVPLTRARYDTLSPNARADCAADVGRFLSALHQTDVGLARACDVGPHTYSLRCAQVLSRAPDVPPFVHGLIEAADFARHRAVLLHGALRAGSVIVDEQGGKVTGITDFSAAAIGDPAWDFVYLYEDYGWDFVTRAVRAYAGDAPGALLRRIRGLQMIETITWVMLADGRPVRH